MMSEFDPSDVRRVAEAVLEGAIAHEVEKGRADKFDHYEQLHRLKCTSEGDEKADRNRELADMCRAALTATG